MSSDLQEQGFQIGCEQERLEQQEHNDLLASQYDNFDGRLCCAAAYLQGKIDKTQEEMDKLTARIDKSKAEYWTRQQELADEFMAEQAAKDTK